MKRPILNNIPLILTGLCLAGTVLFGLTADPHTMSLSESLKSPSVSHPFGTDQLGRDILGRVAYGFFWDFGLASGIVVMSLAAGLAAGLFAGFRGGITDQVLVFLMDLALSLPHIVLAMVVMLYFSYGPAGIVLAMTITGWVKYARVVRAQTFSLREADFIVYERVLGAGTIFIIRRHLLPNVLPSVLGLAVLHLGHSLMSIAALGFLGLGLQPPTPEWGTMLMESRPYIMTSPWTAVFPGLLIFLFIMFFTLAGHRLESRLMPEEDRLNAVD